MSLPEPSGARQSEAQTATARNPAQGHLRSAGTPATNGTPAGRGDTVGDAPGVARQDRPVAPTRSPALRLVIGIALYVLVAIGGIYLAARPGPTAVDRLFDRILPVEYSMHWLTYITDLGRPRAVIPGVAVCCVIAFFWDRRRAITCLVAPAAAIGITEYLAKPAVGRMYGGSLSYPSGHMTSVAALVAVFVLAVPPRWRLPAVVFGTAVDIAVAVTLILLRWHYLTDVLAGLAVAVATTLIVDAILHMLPGPSWLNAGTRTGRSWRSSAL
jgi:membrane-associated phospholipid phosphatase